MNQRKRLIVNSIINVGSVFANGVLQLILVPVLLFVLKDNGLGILATMGVFYTYSRLLNVGFNSAIDRYIPQHLVRNQMEQINIVLSTSIVYFTLVMLLIVTGTIVVAFNFTTWFKLTPDLANTAVLGVYITGLLLASRMPLQPYKAVLSAVQRYDLLRLPEIGLRIFRCLAIIALIWFFSQRSALIFVIVLSSMELVLASLIHYRLAIRHLPGLKIRIRLARWPCFQDMIGYGVSTLLYSVGSMIITQSSILIILYYMSDSEAGRYAIPLYLIAGFNLITVAFTQGTKPAVSKLDAEGNYEQIRQVFLKSSRYANLLVIPICIGMAMASKLLLLAWVGPSKADLWPVLTILTVGFGVFYSQYPSFFVMAALDRHRIFWVMMVLAFVLSIILSVCFLKYSNWGLLGVATGTSLPLLLGWVLVIPTHTCRSLGVPLKTYFHFAVLRPMFATLPLLPLCVSATYWGTDQPLLTLGLLMGLGGAVLGASYWKGCFMDSEKSTVVSALRAGWLPLQTLGR